MANIKTYLNNIKTAVFGSEVRDSIHDAIQQCYDDASAKDNANMEVKMARGEYENLGKRLDSHSSQIKDKANQSDLEVEKQRINLLSKIENGETTGNTELLDIRIDNDGYEHESAGESVRKQIDKCLKYSEGKNIFNKNSIDKVEGYFINRTSGYKSVNDTFVAYILKIKPGSIISVNKSSSVHICFATEYTNIKNQTVDSMINGFISGTTLYSNINVPTNATYMTVSTMKSEIDTLQIEYGASSTSFEEYQLYVPEVDKVDQKVQELIDFENLAQKKLDEIVVINNIVDYDTSEQGYYYNGFNSGSTTVDKQSSAGYKAWQPVDVKKGVIYSFYGNVSLNFSGFTDADGNVISKLGAVAQGNTFSVNNDCKLYITTMGSSDNVMVINDKENPNEFIPFGQSIIKIGGTKIEHKVEIVVGEGQEYTSLKSAIEYATQYSNSKIFVNDGVYDLVSEFGNELETSIGLVLKNNVHIIFSSNSKVTFNYEGDSSYVHTIFSPFNSGEGGFTIENLNLEAKNCRYCVHDERGNSTDRYKNTYKNCKFSLDNTGNPDWSNPQNIGIGFGTNGYIEIDGCIFNSWVTFHNNNGSQTQYESKLVIKNSYFEKGAVMGGSTGSGTDKSIIQVYNNSFLINHQITDGDNIKSYIYNNEIRTS